MTMTQDVVASFVRQGIAVIGSLRVLKEANDRGIMPEVKPVLHDLIAAGMYVSDALYQG
jgi:predicted nucleic acid-binding protein